MPSYAQKQDLEPEYFYYFGFMGISKFESVSRAFSKQSDHFDAEDIANPVLADLRRQVYEHVARYIGPNSHILELNAGTGIDAEHFVSEGHTVLATDLAGGMIEQIRQRIGKPSLEGRLSAEQLSFDELYKLEGQKFNYVFSNSGGLNCIRDLSEVTRHLASLLKPGSYITWVIMPRVYLWELLGVFKGRFRGAFRRFHRDGVMAHLEGEYFKTYYHTLSAIKSAFNDRYTFISTEGLASISPPPHRGDFPLRYPVLYGLLRKIDRGLRSRYPFDRWADHLVVTFRFNR